MAAPECKLCKAHHWPREDHIWPDLKRKADTKPKPRNVTPAEPTKPVTLQPADDIAALKRRIAELEAEVASLRSADTDRKRKSRDRVAAWRAKEPRP